MITPRSFPWFFSTIAISTLACVVLGFTPGSVAADEASGVEGLSLDAAVALAQAQNASVRAARVRLAAAQQARRGAAAPAANPALSIGGGPRFMGTGPEADVGVILEIPIDVGGTARRRVGATSAQLDAARAELRWAELHVGTLAEVLFAEAIAGDARVALGEDRVALLQEMERVARRRHELGEVSLLEPNFAALERVEAQATLLSTRRMRGVAYRELAALLALPESDSLTLTAGPVPRWPAGTPSTLDELMRGAEPRADLLAAQEAARGAHAGLRVAQAMGAPSLAASAGWRREGVDANLVELGVRFELPFQRNQLGVASAEGAVGLSEIRVDVAGLAVPRELAAALEGWDAASERYRLTTGETLPLAQQNLALVLRAYEAGKEALLAVLLIQRQALAARSSAIDAELGLHRSAAALERAVGQEIF